jgi:ubiquinone/menaquinone biosynthesis C-methylase UbiE
LADLRGGTGDWDQVARGQHRSGRRDGLVDEHGRDTYLSLVEKWADLTSGARVLKTDLFDVAFASHPFLFNLARSGISVVGIDVSREVVGAAKRRAEQHGFDAGRYLRCDVRGIPLREDSIDLIVSDSTLDH